MLQAQPDVKEITDGVVRLINKRELDRYSFSEMQLCYFNCSSFADVLVSNSGGSGILKRGGEIRVFGAGIPAFLPDS